MTDIEKALAAYLGEVCGMRLRPHALTGLAQAAIAAMQSTPQEPVAWLYTDRTNGRRMVSLDMRNIPACAETPLYAHPPAQQEPVAFQQEVDSWMDACFGQTIKADKLERCDRFIEEALEFVQAIGYFADRAHALVDYVFGRPTGEVKQEVGGVMVTLAAACNTVGVDIQDAAQTELARVWTKVEAIRAKQAAKPTGSALPIPTPPNGGSDAE